MIDPKERRCSPRIASRFPVRYRLIPFQAPDQLEGDAEDVSLDGVRFRCRDNLRARAGLLIELLIPDGPPVHSFGRAAWVRELPGEGGFEVGGRFIDQSTATRRAIERHIDHESILSTA